MRRKHEEQFRWMIGSEVVKDGKPDLKFWDKVYPSFSHAENELIDLADKMVTKTDKGDFVWLFNSLIIFAFDKKTNLTHAVFTVRYSDKLRHLREYLNVVIVKHYDKED